MPTTFLVQFPPTMIFQPVHQLVWKQLISPLDAQPHHQLFFLRRYRIVNVSLSPFVLLLEDLAVFWKGTDLEGLAET
jgi:hypothetical protein